MSKQQCLVSCLQYQHYKDLIRDIILNYFAFIRFYNLQNIFKGLHYCVYFRGLLGAHSMAVILKKNKKGMEWYNKELLDKATVLADKLLLAFNTSTGIPYPKVKIKSTHVPILKRNIFLYCLQIASVSTSCKVSYYLYNEE